MSLFSAEVGLEALLEADFPFPLDTLASATTTAMDPCPSPAFLDASSSMHEYSDMDQASTTDPLVIANSVPPPSLSGLTEQVLASHDLSFATSLELPSSPEETATPRLRNDGAVHPVRSRTSKTARRRGPLKKESQQAQLATLAVERQKLQRHRQVGHSVVEDVLRVLQMMAADRKL